MIDIMPGGNVYPWASSGGGVSLGMRMSGASVFPGSPAKEDAAAAPGPEAAVTLGGAPSIWVAGATFVALLILLMFAGHALDGKEEFKNIKVSAYNALVIGLAAVVMLPVLKFLASKQPIAAVKSWVLAA